MILAEYIEKTQLIEKLKHRVSTDDDSKFATGFIKGTNEALGIIEEWIASIPAADVAPVVHGYWISEYIGYGVTRYRCSRCGVIIGESEIDDFGHSKYCCMCGAKMDGGGDSD